MATRFGLFTKRFFLFLNVALVFLFLLAVVAPYLDPEDFWFISFLGLGFPFLLTAMVIFFFGWLFTSRKMAILPLVALLLGYKSIGAFFAVHPDSAFRYSKEKNVIRVATWNVARFVEMKRNNNAGSRTRLRMMEQIKEQDADVLCFQEFFHSIAPGWYPNLSYISKSFGYPYYYYSHDDDGDNHFIGTVIFSRYPMIDSGMVRYPRPSLPDALMHVDLKVGPDTVRIFSTHLQSLQLGASDYATIDQIKDGEPGVWQNSRTIFSKWKRGVSNRKLQTDIVEKVTADSPHPSIVCGDLNDVPNSYTYFTVRGGKQDAFLEKGFGIGRTFSAISPTLRIDYVFADESFEVKQVKRIVKNYSDHYMLVADLVLRSKD